ncbi:MAG: NADH-quinone oxidoreductase subunit C [Candidatus Methanomethylicaceae archaeon]
MKPEDISSVLEGFVKEFKITGVRRISAVSDRGAFKKALEALKKKGAEHISTITGVDLGNEILVIYHIDCGDGVVLNLRLTLSKEDPSLPTVTDLFPGAALYERDLMEMLGIKVNGHPNPSHLFLPDDWPQGVYPLRKEFTKLEEKK